MLHYLQTDVLRVNKPAENDGSFMSLYMSLQAASPAEENAPTPEYSSFEELYNALLRGIESGVAWLHTELDKRAPYHTPEAPSTALVLSLFVEGCIERGIDFSKGGAYYDVEAIHMGGVQDCANSLLAIKKLVYDDKLITLSELITLLRKDWEGREDLRLYALNKLPHFGNDNAQSNEMTRRLLKDYIAIVRKYDHRADGVKCPPGVSTFGRECEWRYARGATADGHKRGDILSPNLSPAPGADKKWSYRRNTRILLSASYRAGWLLRAGYKIRAFYGARRGKRKCHYGTGKGLLRAGRLFYADGYCR